MEQHHILVVVSHQCLNAISIDLRSDRDRIGIGIRNQKTTFGYCFVIDLLRKIERGEKSEVRRTESIGRQYQAGERYLSSVGTCSCEICSENHYV